MKLAGIICILMLGLMSGMAHPLNRLANDIEGRVDKESIVRFLEKFRGHMNEPIPALGIPQLEPLNLGDYPFDFNNSMAVVSGAVTGVKVKGLSGFVVNDGALQMFILKYKLNISLPIIEVIGDYQARGVLANLFHIDGAGPFKVQIFESNVYTDGNMRPVNSSIKMDKMNLKLNIAGININFENLTDKENVNDFVNAFLNNAALPLFQLYRPMLESEAVKYIVPVFDEKMSGITTKDLMDIFDGNKDFFPSGPDAE